MNLRVIAGLGATFFVAALSGAEAATAPVGTCAGTQDKAACDHIIAAEISFTGMLTTGDPTPVRTHLADDAVWTLADGRRWGKQEAIGNITNGPRMADSQAVRVDVTLFGDVALVQWAERWTTEGTPGRSGASFGTDTWMKRDGRWQMIGLQEAGGQ